MLRKLSPNPLKTPSEGIDVEREPAPAPDSLGMLRASRIPISIGIGLSVVDRLEGPESTRPRIIRQSLRLEVSASCRWVARVFQQSEDSEIKKEPLGETFLIGRVGNGCGVR
jgi:hypothetical protein